MKNNVKLLIPVGFALLVLAGAWQIGPVHGPAFVSAADNKAIVSRYYDEVWNQGDLFVLGEIFQPDLVDQTCIAAQGPGLEGFQQVIASVQEGYANATFTVEDMVAEGDMVVARWTFDATFKPTNSQLSFGGHETWRLKGDKIAERWGTLDFLSLMSQTFANASPIPALPADTGNRPALRETEAVRMYYEEVFNNGSLDLVEVILDDDFVDHSPDAGQKPDRDGFKTSVREFCAAFANSRFTIDNLTVKEDKIWVDWTYRGDFPATGAPVEFGGTEVWIARNGRIEERWGEYDLQALVDQVGLTTSQAQLQPVQPVQIDEKSGREETTGAKR